MTIAPNPARVRNTRYGARGMANVATVCLGGCQSIQKVFLFSGNIWTVKSLPTVATQTDKRVIVWRAPTRERILRELLMLLVVVMVVMLVQVGIMVKVTSGTTIATWKPI